MSNYVDFVIKITDAPTILAWLATYNIDVNRDEGGVVLSKDESMIGETCSPIEKDVTTLDEYITIRFLPIVAVNIPPGTKLNYIMWRSDVGGPRPTFTVNTYDIDGNITGTRQQEVAKIRG